jgi:hypothetical protein
MMPAACRTSGFVPFEWAAGGTGARRTTDATRNDDDDDVPLLLPLLDLIVSFGSPPLLPAYSMRLVGQQ